MNERYQFDQFKSSWVPWLLKDTQISLSFQEISFLKNTNSYFVAKGFQTFHSITFGAFEALSKIFAFYKSLVIKAVQ